jgi:YHS domain-containing protein
VPRSAFGAVLILLLQASAAGAIDPIYENWRGLAIRGMDPVAYFNEGKPVDGSSDYSTQWKGSTWCFASAANRDAFLDDRPLG